MVHKGKVSTILNGGTSITVIPYSGGAVTAPITVPFFLIGALPVGTPIAYVSFEDNTGVVLSRMDGDWNHRLQPIEGVEVYAVIEDGVCRVRCGGTSDFAATIEGNVCVVSCLNPVADVSATIKDGVCVVSCSNAI